MSRENMELHRRSIDAVNRRDFGAFLALMDEEVEAVSRIAAVEGGLHGHDGIRKWWENWFSAFPDYNIEIVEMDDFDDVTVSAMRALGHGASSALPFEDKIWLALRWRAAKAIWWRVFYTREEVLETLGLSEQDARADS
jgi:hypothetical protein